MEVALSHARAPLPREFLTLLASAMSRDSLPPNGSLGVDDTTS